MRQPALRLLAILLATLALAGCDPRDCWLGIAHGDCPADGPGLAAFPQDDAICQSYGLAPGTSDYAICRAKKREVRGLTANETDYGFLQNPLTPNVTVVPTAPH